LPLQFRLPWIRDVLIAIGIGQLVVVQIYGSVHVVMDEAKPEAVVPSTLTLS
jgi:hypothetical protein